MHPEQNSYSYPLGSHHSLWGSVLCSWTEHERCCFKEVIGVLKDTPRASTAWGWCSFATIRSSACVCCFLWKPNLDALETSYHGANSHYELGRQEFMYVSPGLSWSYWRSGPPDQLWHCSPVGFTFCLLNVDKKSLLGDWKQAGYVFPSQAEAKGLPCMCIPWGQQVKEKGDIVFKAYDIWGFGLLLPQGCCGSAHGLAYLRLLASWAAPTGCLYPEVIRISIAHFLGWGEISHHCWCGEPGVTNSEWDDELWDALSSPHASVPAYNRELLYPCLLGERTHRMVLTLWGKALISKQLNYSVISKKGVLCSLHWLKILRIKICSGSLQEPLSIGLVVLSG